MFSLICFVVVLAVLIWSGISPADRLTWWLEVAPVLIALPLLVFTRKRFPLTPLLVFLVTVHAVVLMVGGHYTYAQVPMGEWLSGVFHTGRNSYDGLGHFMQGFVPAIAARELLLRTSPLKPGKWLFAIIVLGCLGIAAAYELIEWAAAMAGGSGADEFLGTQGDVWDTQKDMALAGIGAIVALLMLGRFHDRLLQHRD